MFPIKECNKTLYINLKQNNIWLGKSTSNSASASMSIWKILAWILGSSAEKNVPQVHLPLGWSPNAQIDICLSSSSRSLWTLSELCKNRKCTWMKDKNKADCRWKQKKSIHRTEDKQRGGYKSGGKGNIYANTKTSCNHCIPLPKELENNFI